MRQFVILVVEGKIKSVVSLFVRVVYKCWADEGRLSWFCFGVVMMILGYSMLPLFESFN